LIRARRERFGCMVPPKPAFRSETARAEDRFGSPRRRRTLPLNQDRVSMLDALVSMKNPSGTPEVDTEELLMLEDLRNGLRRFEGARSNLIPILQMLQERYQYLSPAAMKLVAAHLNISTVEVYGVASFYNQFRFHPPGKHQIQVCMGTACHVRAADVILENFERKLGIKEGQTTPDREFSLERVACVGCCALAPVAVVDRQVQAGMQPSKVEGILLGFQIEKERLDREKQNRGSDSSGTAGT